MVIEKVKTFSFGGMGWDSLFVGVFGMCLTYDNALCNFIAGTYGAYLLLYVVFVRRLPYSFQVDILQNAIYLPVLFFVLLLSLLYSDDKTTGWVVLMKHITLVCIPLFFALSHLTSKERDMALRLFVLANFGVFIFNIIRATWRSFHNPHGQSTFDATVFGGQEFWYSIVQGGNFYFIDQFSTFFHPTYWSMHLLLSAVIILHFFQTSKFFTLRTKISYLAVLFCIALGILMCSSRIIMLATLLLILFYFASIVFQKQKYGLAALGFVICGLLALLVIYSPRVGGFSNLGNYLNYSLRVQSWQAAFNVVRENPIFGTGIGDAEADLISEYSKLGFEENKRLALNEHNQYLQIASQAGIAGLLIFSLAIIRGFGISIRTWNFLQFGFVLSVALVCMVEDFLSRQAGITFFTFFYCLLFVKTNDVN